MKKVYLENWIYLTLINKHTQIAIDNNEEELINNLSEENLKELEDIRFALRIIEKYCEESE